MQAASPGRARLVDSIGTVLRDKVGEIFYVSPSDSVYAAIELMADKKIGALLVMSEGRLVGIISERDYARKVILKGKSSKETAVGTIMTSPVLTVTPYDTVEECMKLMTTHRIRHLPVIDRGNVVNILSIGDLVKWIISSHERTIDELHSYIAGNYPG